VGEVINLEARRQRRHLNDRSQLALDSPLPPFPELAWRGLFGLYRDLMMNDTLRPGTPVSECPQQFHFANLLALCAAEMGHGVRLLEATPTFANFYILCCGKSGTKKSTASSLAKEYIYRRFPDTPLQFRVSSMSSGEGLIRTLGNHGNVFLCYNELKDLFSTAARSGSKIESNLNDAFDLSPLHNIVKRSKESITVDEYYFNLLGNCTPEHVLLDMSESLFKGGLLNRFLVFAAKPNDVSKPRMGIPDNELANRIARDIFTQCKEWLQIATTRGQVTICYTPEAEELQEAWYNRNNAVAKHLNDLEAVPMVRLDLFAKKLAMVFAFYETAPTRTPFITAAHMEAAIAIVEFCRGCMQWMVDAWVGQRTIWQQAEALAEKRIESYLQREGCITEQQLYRQMNMSFSECTKAVDALRAAGIATVSGHSPRTIHLFGYCTCDL
jgi:hypothetical protein